MPKKILCVFLEVLLIVTSTTALASVKENFDPSPRTHQMTLDFKQVNLRDALRVLAEWNHYSLVLSPEVQGSVVLSLNRAAPKEAFHFLLKAHGLKAWKTGNIWYVSSAEKIVKQQQEDRNLSQALEESSLLVTRVWQLRYAKVEDLVRWLNGDHHSWLSKRGLLYQDPRTNILCVRDTEERLNAIHALIKRLDVSVQQVLIEARLASVDSDYERELGLNFSTTRHDAGADSDDDSQRMKKISFDSRGKFSLAIASLADSSLLDVKLAALEQEGRGELISSPSLLTASRQTASIEAGEEIPYQEASSSGATTVVFKKAVLSLKVTPQILPDKKILLQLQINQDRPNTRVVLGVPAISTRQMITNVLIPNGHTVVLGGIYESDVDDHAEGFPFLGKIPILGWLLQEHKHRLTKRELLVFVTPKIVGG